MRALRSSGSRRPRAPQTARVMESPKVRVAKLPLLGLAISPPAAGSFPPEPWSGRSSTHAARLQPATGSQGFSARSIFLSSFGILSPSCREESTIAAPYIRGRLPALSLTQRGATTCVPFLGMNQGPACPGGRKQGWRKSTGVQEDPPCEAPIGKSPCCRTVFRQTTEKRFRRTPRP